MSAKLCTICGKPKTIILNEVTPVDMCRGHKYLVDLLDKSISFYVYDEYTAQSILNDLYPTGIIEATWEQLAMKRHVKLCQLPEPTNTAIYIDGKWAVAQIIRLDI